MKKVRLFALAASMGMFVSTVSAASVTAKPADSSKHINSVVFGNVEEIVRGEFGAEVIAPNVKVEGFSEERTTKLPKNYNALGGVCYEGFSSTVGKDNNLDGTVDKIIMSIGSNGIGDDKANEFWYFDNTKTFPTVDTIKFYLGQTETGVGGRIMAPNQAAKDGYVMVNTVKNAANENINYHSFYENNTAGVEKLIEMLIDAGKIVEIIENDKLVGYKTKPIEVDTAVSGKKDGVIDYATTTQITISDIDDGSRTKLYDVKEAMVQLLSGDKSFTQLLKNTIKTQKMEYHNYDGTNATTKYEVKYSIPQAEFDAAGKVDGGAVSADVNLAAGSVVVVDGNGKVLEVFTDLQSLQANGADFEDYYAKTRITLLRQTSRYGIEEIDSLVPAKLGNVAKYDAAYLADTETFSAQYELDGAGENIDLTTTSEINKWIKAGNGLYRVDTPKNPTDKFVFMFDLGVKNYPTLDYVYASATKGTIEYLTPSGEELVVKGTKVGTRMYPTFDTEAQAVEFMAMMSDFGIINAADRLAQFKGTRTWANGDTQENYAPKNGLDHASAKQCTFSGTKTPLEAGKVVVTNDAASINTNEFGVHTLTYTAKIGDEVLGTATSKVVIAPKYERKYVNGKVVELKAFHMNGKLYIKYDYNYAKNEVTTTYYEHDGVTVVKTSTAAIK